MTLEDLRKIARTLSNTYWCRYWIHWNWPTEEPWEMALSCLEMQCLGQEVVHRPVYLSSLEEKGFTEEVRDGLIYYVVRRTEENGEPWVR